MLSILILTIAASASMPDCLPDCMPDIAVPVVSQEPAPLPDMLVPPPLPQTAEKPKRVLVVETPANSCPKGNCSKPTTYQTRGTLFRRWR